MSNECGKGSGAQVDELCGRFVHTGLPLLIERASFADGMLVGKLVDDSLWGRHRILFARILGCGAWPACGKRRLDQNYENVGQG